MHLVWLAVCISVITSSPISTKDDERDGELSRKILGSSVVTSVSVVMETGNGKHTYYSDAVGHPISKPHIASQVASPINLLNPDRYEFYTFNDNGELVKRLMTIDEIQGIIAGGDVDNLNYSNEYTQMMNPDNDVSDIVENVQNVLKEEIESHKYTQEGIPILDTPDVSDTWDTILPAVFGGNIAGHDDTIPEMNEESTSQKYIPNDTTENPKDTTKLTPMSNLERTTEDIYIQTTNKITSLDNLTSNNVPNLEIILEESDLNNKNKSALLLPDTTVNNILENMLIFTEQPVLYDKIETSGNPTKMTTENDKIITLPVITERINLNNSIVETMATKMELPKITELVSIITRPVTQVTEKLMTSSNFIQSTNSVQENTAKPILIEVNEVKISTPTVDISQDATTKIDLNIFDKISDSEYNDDKIKIPLWTKPDLTNIEELKNVPAVVSDNKLEITTVISSVVKNSEKLNDIPLTHNEVKIILTTSAPQTSSTESILNAETEGTINITFTEQPNINKIASNTVEDNKNIPFIQHDEFESSTSVASDNFEKTNSPQLVPSNSNLENIDTNNIILNKISETLVANVTATNETTLIIPQNYSNNEISTTDYNIISDLDELIANISNQFSTDNIEIQPYNATNEIENVLNTSINMSEHLEQAVTIASAIIDSNRVTTDTTFTKTKDISSTSNFRNITNENMHTTEIYTEAYNFFQEVVTSTIPTPLSTQNDININITEKLPSEKHQVTTEDMQKETFTTPLLQTTITPKLTSIIPEPITENIASEISTATANIIAESSKDTKPISILYSSTQQPIIEITSTTVSSKPTIEKNITLKPFVSEVTTNTVVVFQKNDTQSPLINTNKTSEMENEKINKPIDTSTELPVPDITTTKLATNTDKIVTTTKMVEQTSTQPSTIKMDTTSIKISILNKTVVPEKIPNVDNSVSVKPTEITTLTPVEITEIEHKTTQATIPSLPTSYTLTQSTSIESSEGSNLNVTTEKLGQTTSKDEQQNIETTVKISSKNTNKPSKSTATINSTVEGQPEPYRKTDDSFHTNKISTTDTWKLVQTVLPPSLGHKKNDSSSIVTTEKANIEIYQPTLKIDMSTQGTFGMSDLNEDMYMFSKLYNELALKFWNALSMNDISTDRSVMVSPFGGISVLAMIFLGARGGTSGEMNDLLKLDDIVTFNPHLTFKEVTDSIISRKSLSAVVRELFTDSSKGKVLEFYKGRVKQFYDGHVEEVDFKRINNVIRRRTNSLINKQTRGQMPQYLEETTLHLRAPLSALSTNIFQADCSHASTEGRDGELYFIVLPSMRQRRLVPIPAAVWRSRFIAGYDPELDATAVSLGNTNQVISTVFVIPGQQGHSAPGDVLLRLEARLLNTTYMPETWLQLLRSMLPRPGLEVQLPRFLHKSVINTTAALKRMGLDELFDMHKANLQGLNGIAHDLYFSDLVQVNEFSICGETQQMHSEIYPSMIEYLGSHNEHMRNFKYMDYFEEYDYDKYLSIPLPLRPRQARLPDVPRLRFDRPFLYFIRHNPTGLILHMGRFNPRLST